MNQVLRITNLTQGVISLSGQYYSILPGKFIEVPHMEVPNLMSRIQLFQHRGWVSASYVSENGVKELPILEKMATIESPQDEYIHPTAEEQEVIGAYEDPEFLSPIESRKDGTPINPLVNKRKNAMNGKKEEAQSK